MKMEKPVYAGLLVTPSAFGDSYIHWEFPHHVEGFSVALDTTPALLHAHFAHPTKSTYLKSSLKGGPSWTQASHPETNEYWTPFAVGGLAARIRSNAPSKDAAIGLIVGNGPDLMALLDAYKSQFSGAKTAHGIAVLARGVSLDDIGEWLDGPKTRLIAALQPNAFIRDYLKDGVGLEYRR